MITLNMELDLQQEQLQEEEPIKNLDISWIKEFEETDKFYEKYYLDDLYSLNLHSIYVDVSKNIINTKKERFFLKKVNFISKEELIFLLKKNGSYLSKQYKIKDILRYNIKLKPEEIKFFLQNPSNHIYDEYLQQVEHIEDIFFSPSISMFQDLNDLYLIYMEKPLVSETVTKRVIFNKKSKKTRRQRQ